MIHFPPRAQACASRPRPPARDHDLCWYVVDTAGTLVCLFHDEFVHLVSPYSRDYFDYFTAVCLGKSQHSVFDRMRAWSWFACDYVYIWSLMVPQCCHCRSVFFLTLPCVIVGDDDSLIKAWWWKIIFHQVRRLVPRARASLPTLWTRGAILTIMSRSLTWYSMISRL